MNEGPCSDFTAQPYLKGEHKRKVTEPKQILSFWFYTRAAHMDICNKRPLKFEKRNNIYKQVWTLPVWLLWDSVRCRLGVWGRLESSSQGRAGEEVLGCGEVEKETSPYHPSQGSFTVCHALEKVIMNVKVTTIPWNNPFSSLLYGFWQLHCHICIFISFEVFFFPLLFLLLWFIAKKKIIKKMITLWQGFHPFPQSLSFRQVHSIVHIH